MTQNAHTRDADSKEIVSHISRADTSSVSGDDMAEADEKGEGRYSWSSSSSISTGMNHMRKPSFGSLGRSRGSSTSSGEGVPPLHPEPPLVVDIER